MTQIKNKNRFSRLAVALVVFLPVVILVFVFLSSSEKSMDNGITDPAEASSISEAETTPNEPIEPEPDSRLNRLNDGRVEFLPGIEVSLRIHNAETVEGSLAELDTLLGLYRFAFGENPVGVENFEFTEQLLGKNPKQVVFIATDSPALRGNELVDRWGTPYFFHPMSEEDMDLRSAGPDRLFWTQDDIELNSQDSF